jgi:hypothetical protein
MYRDKNKVTTLTIADVVSMLETNDAFVEASIVALYKRQTELEQRVSETFNKNDIGMQVADARLFSRLARKLLNNERLTQDELREVRRPWHRAKVAQATICKYRKQILQMIEEAAKARMRA